GARAVLHSGGVVALVQLNAGAGTVSLRIRGIEADGLVVIREGRVELVLPEVVRSALLEHGSAGRGSIGRVPGGHAYGRIPGRPGSPHSLQQRQGRVFHLLAAHVLVADHALVV